MARFPSIFAVTPVTISPAATRSRGIQSPGHSNGLRNRAGAELSMPGVLFGWVCTLRTDLLYSYTLVQHRKRGKCSGPEFGGGTIDQQENGESGHNNGRAG